MVYDKAYTLALFLSSQFELTLPFEDRVQECLIKWWKVKTRSPKYIYACMRHRLIDLARRERVRRTFPLEFEVSDISTQPDLLLERGQTITHMFPKNANVTKKFVDCMWQNNFSLQDTCKEQGISYTTGASRWRKAKRLARERCKDETF